MTAPKKKKAADYKQAPLLPVVQLDPLGSAGLAQLRPRCQNCVKCSLSQGSPTLVFGEGNPDCPDVCFVGEAPGAKEEEQGRPFVGPSGQLLDRMIRAMGYERDQLFITNVILHRPPDNRPPTPLELKACYEHFVAQIRSVRPKTIVALGASAVAAMVGGKKKIGELRGKWLEWEKVPVMPTYHPSYLLRANGAEGLEFRKRVWADLQMVMYKVGKPIPLPLDPGTAFQRDPHATS